ncbi:MAG: tetratricopeptide repeat protein, partial [Planctomycetota bacterium]
MFKSKALLVISAIVICFLPASAQGSGDTERLTSASASKVFYEIAYEIANSPDVTGAEAEQAIILLTAALNLDNSASHVIPVLIKLTSQYSEGDNSKLVYQLLTTYVDKSAEADLEPARVAIRYLLNQLNSREEREGLLKKMLMDMGGKNAFLDSELATSLGILIAETPDSESAQQYLMQAYYNNKYNKQAFARLAELMSGQISPAMYLEHLRLQLDQNPIDLEAALGFAQYAEQLELYDTAAGAYEYCDKLFGFLYPSQPLPASIYLPWSISCYNTQRNQHKCLQIAERLRQENRFDLLLEAIAGKAALKTGNPDLAKRILEAAEKNAHFELINRKFNHDTKAIKYEQLAWFYCFASQDPNKAVDWANKAYSIGPKSSTAAALLAYSLVMNGETEWAKLLTSNYKLNQIAE